LGSQSIDRGWSHGRVTHDRLAARVRGLPRVFRQKRQKGVHFFDLERRNTNCLPLLRVLVVIDLPRREQIRDRAWQRGDDSNLPWRLSDQTEKSRNQMLHTALTKLAQIVEHDDRRLRLDIRLKRLPAIDWSERRCKLLQKIVSERVDPTV